MQVIPVIDVKGGIAVRALAGDRARYKPLVTPLAEGCDPAAIAHGYQTLFPFGTLYVADLDGIEGRGADPALHKDLAEVWTGGSIWIDDGRLAGGDETRLRYVTGSETLLEAGLCQVFPGETALSRARVLSLDFKGPAFMGPPELLALHELWPRDVIVMTLGRVGTGEGPDLALLKVIVDRAGPQRCVYAAGGVRDRDDLRRLADAGAHGALIATALHTGKIKTGDLEEIAGW